LWDEVTFPHNDTGCVLCSSNSASAHSRELFSTLFFTSVSCQLWVWFQRCCTSSAAHFSALWDQLREPAANAKIWHPPRMEMSDPGTAGWELQ